MLKNAWASVIGHQWVVPQWRPSVRLTAIFSHCGYVWQWPKWQVDSTADLKLLELTIFPHHFQLARRAENRKIKKHEKQKHLPLSYYGKPRECDTHRSVDDVDDVDELRPSQTARTDWTAHCWSHHHLRNVQVLISGDSRWAFTVPFVVTLRKADFHQQILVFGQCTTGKHLKQLLLEPPKPLFPFHFLDVHHGIPEFWLIPNCSRNRCCWTLCPTASWSASSHPPRFAKKWRMPPWWKP